MLEVLEAVEGVRYELELLKVLKCSCLLANNVQML